MSAIEQRAAKGFVPGAALFALTALQPLVVTPILLTHWNSEHYGVWILLMTMVTTMQFLDVGYQAYAGNEFNRLYVESRTELRATASGILQVSFVLGGVYLMAGAVFYCSGWWARTLPQGISDSLQSDAGWAFALLVLGWGLQGSVTGLFAKLYAPAGYYARSQWWGVALRGGTMVALIVSAVWSDRLWHAALAVMLVTLCQGVGVMWDAHGRFKDLFEWWRPDLRRRGFTALLHSLPLIAANFVDGFVQSAMLVYVGGHYLGGGVALFVTLRTMVNVMSQVAALAVWPVVPDLVRYVVRCEGDKLRDLLRAVWLLSLGVGGVLLAGLCLVAAPLYELWTRGVVDFDPMVFAALAFGAMARLAGFPCVVYMRALNYNGTALAGLVIQAVVLFVGISWLGSGRGLAWTAVLVAMADLAANFLWPATFTVWHMARHRLGSPGPILAATGLLVAWFALGWRVQAALSVSPLGIAAIQFLGASCYLAFTWRGLSDDARRRLSGLPRRLMP